MDEGYLARLRWWWTSRVKIASVAQVAVVLAVAAAIAYFWPRDTSGLGKRELGVRDLIVQVRKELAETEREMLRCGRQALFTLRDMEMEIRYTVQEGGQLKVESAGIGGNVDRSAENAQVLRLKWDVAGAKSGVTDRGGDPGIPTQVRTVGAPAAVPSTPALAPAAPDC
jgi:hypothetical protein